MQAQVLLALSDLGLCDDDDDWINEASKQARPTIENGDETFVIVTQYGAVHLV